MLQVVMILAMAVTTQPSTRPATTRPATQPNREIALAMRRREVLPGMVPIQVRAMLSGCEESHPKNGEGRWTWTAYLKKQTPRQRVASTVGAEGFGGHMSTRYDWYGATRTRVLLRRVVAEVVGGKIVKVISDESWTPETSPEHTVDREVLIGNQWTWTSKLRP